MSRAREIFSLRPKNGCAQDDVLNVGGENPNVSERGARLRRCGQKILTAKIAKETTRRTQRTAPFVSPIDVGWD
jgi:hypothetical protein